MTHPTDALNDRNLTRTSSGGLFHFFGEYGLATENVKNFEVSHLKTLISAKARLAESSLKVILAEGNIIDVNAECNSDLFWALKGGGANSSIACADLEQHE